MHGSLFSYWWQRHIGARRDRPQCSRSSACCQSRFPQKNSERERGTGGKNKSCRSPSDSGESAAMQSWTMCWIGSLYISLPFGHSNATLPYEGTSTRSTCSKQNTIGDRLQRNPPTPSPSPDCLRQTLSLTRERGEWGGDKLFSQSPNNKTTCWKLSFTARGQAQTGNSRICQAGQL